MLQEDRKYILLQMHIAENEPGFNALEMGVWSVFKKYCILLITDSIRILKVIL